MRHVFVTTIAFVACSFVASLSLAAEQVPSPQYQSWAKYKPGTATTMKQKMTGGGMTFDMETHQELVEVTADKAVIRAWTVMNMMGREQTSPKKSITLPATVDKGSEDVPPDYNGKVEVLGNEKVTVGGKEYDCKVMRFTGKQGAIEAEGKLWGSDTVPGRTVKLEMTAKGETPMEMKGELTKVDVKE